MSHEVPDFLIIPKKEKEQQPSQIPLPLEKSAPKKKSINPDKEPKRVIIIDI
jgi:hypothetical protein